MDDRWTTYSHLRPSIARGWSPDIIAGPRRLAGANGSTIGPDGRLYVAHLFGSQVTAIEVESGEHDAFSPLGAPIAGPDDVIFLSAGTLFATEPREIIDERYTIGDEIRQRRRSGTKAGKTPQRPLRTDATEAAFPATTIDR